MGRGQARPLHRQAAEPGQHQEPADQPALLLRPDHRVGLPQPAATAARCSPATCPSSTSRCPRFLDDAAATKLLRPSRADPDPLSRLIVELLARTGIRKSELLGAHRRRRRPDRLRLLAADPDRQAPQRPLHPAAPPAQGHARRLDRPPPARRAALRPAPARTQPTHHRAARRHRAAPPAPPTPASATSPPTSSATPWPPRPSTAA